MHAYLNRLFYALSMDIELDLPPMIAPMVDQPTLTRYGQWNVGALPGEAMTGTDAASKALKLTAKQIFGDTPIRDHSLADCCVAGLRLLHGWLDPSHDISQSIKTAEGSFWHGIMHRLEGDYWNSKYWFRQVGRHPVVIQLQAQFPNYPDGFVDQVEAIVSEQSADPATIEEIQQQAIAEWQQLFAFCCQNAVE